MTESTGIGEMYRVVVNHEEQYSIWPDGRDTPAGWSLVGGAGSKDQCLAYIREAWTDMRPKSLREWMGGTVGDQPTVDGAA